MGIKCMEKGERGGGKFNKDPVNIYLFKVKNKNSRKRCDLCNICEKVSYTWNSD